LPLYAYRCTQCGHRFEKIQKFRSKPELVCPQCGGLLEHPLTAPRLHFKGAGWYVNDYGGKSGPSAAESLQTEAASDTTSSAKPDATSAAGGSASGSPAAAPAPSTAAAPVAATSE
jgi:putative FmdB family regulatory protein